MYVKALLAAGADANQVVAYPGPDHDRRADDDIDICVPQLTTAADLCRLNDVPEQLAQLFPEGDGWGRLSHECTCM